MLDSIFLVLLLQNLTDLRVRFEDQTGFVHLLLFWGFGVVVAGDDALFSLKEALVRDAFVDFNQALCSTCLIGEQT